MAELDRLNHVAVRLLVAVVPGGRLGLQREKSGRAAGLRTHVLVTVGAALFVIIPQQEGIGNGDLARAGIGFLGGGAILKPTDARPFRGLTTAAGIGLAAALGSAVGLGRFCSALVAFVPAFVVLEVLYRLDWLIGNNEESGKPQANASDR